MLTDRYQGETDQIRLIDLREDRVVWTLQEPEAQGTPEPGRNPSHVDNHPVFTRDGKGIWLNRMDARGLSQLVRMEIPEEVLRP